MSPLNQLHPRPPHQRRLHWFATCRRAWHTLAFIAGLAWVLAGNSLAQPTNGAVDPILDAWQTDAGLPHNSVTAILQTSDHYLWIGTSNGLARFDGVRFSVYRTVDYPGLRSNRILCLFEDSRRTLWVGTDDGGLARYRNSGFEAFTISDGLASDSVFSMGEDRSGRLWAGTATGLDRWNAAAPSEPFKPENFTETRVNAICQPRGGPLTFATPNGLRQFSEERLARYDGPGWAALKTNLDCLRGDATGGFWAGGDAGLFHVGFTNGVASEPVRVLDAKVLAVTADAAGNAWCGTADGAVYQITPAGAALVWRFSNAVSALCADVEGNLWAGTAGGGLYRIKPRQLRWIPFSGSLNDTRVASVFRTSEGERWLVSGDQGLYRGHHGRFTFLERLPLPAGVFVQTACATRDGALWLGTLGDGLFQYKNGTLSQFSERDGVSDSSIKVLCADGDGLWIGTRNGGLNYLKDRTVTRINTPWGFVGNSASVLCKDAQGSLWIGTGGDGLYQYADGKFTGYTWNERLPSSTIHSLHADRDGTLWVGTARGLARMLAGQVTAYTNGSGLAEEAILQLRSDAEGNLWAGSSSRIFRARKDQLNAYAEGRLSWVDVIPYNREDGLPGIQCVTDAQSESWESNNNEVWFLTAKGLVLKQPVLAWNTNPPPVLLESVFVENESVSLADEIRVPPGKESLRFQYTAPSLTAPGKVSFRYQLEGFDRDWSEASGARAARYPKVPPGKYRFRVIACNNDGVWNTAGASVNLVVTPFWWATGWFRVGLAAAGAALLLGLYRLRQARRRDLERLRVRIASDLHDDVGSSLWSITLLSRMLARQESLGPEERQDADEIHRIAIQTSNSIRDIIWLINPAFDTVQDLVLRTKDFAGTALRGVDYRLHCEESLLTRKLPLDFRQNLFFLFKEALTNIAKHSRATVAELRIEEVGGRWRITIHDNGIGFDPAADTRGNGLKSLRARAAKIGAALDIQSHPGGGSTIVLTTDRP
jgi:ligand-binding sensor domain-containing protein/signal transduction histidine kinase